MVVNIELQFDRIWTHGRVKLPGMCLRDYQIRLTEVRSASPNVGRDMPWAGIPHGTEES